MMSVGVVSGGSRRSICVRRWVSICAFVSFGVVGSGFSIVKWQAGLSLSGGELVRSRFVGLCVICA